MAHVEFTREEFAAFARSWIGEPEGFEEELNALYELMLEANGNRAIGEAMEAANDFLEGPGDVESLFARDGRIVTDAWDSTFLIDYVNAGDTYAQTLIYEYERRTFYLGTWGDFVERWEAANPPELEENEDVCRNCNEVRTHDEFHYDDRSEDEGPICTTCRPTPTWRPRADQPHIATLRSAEGVPVAVHLFERGQDPTIAFSVITRGRTNSPYDEQFIAKEGDTPYLESWVQLVERSRRGPQLYVASTNPNLPYGTNRDVSIEAEALSRLRVAMDAFFESGMEHQPQSAFLEAPPVLWRCSQINYIVWSDGEGGHNMPAAVEAFVAEFEDGLYGPGSGPVHSDISVWSASGEELESLIEDGFVKWRDDDSVRAYLQELGVCRAK